MAYIASMTLLNLKLDSSDSLERTEGFTVSAVPTVARPPEALCEHACAPNQIQSL